MFVLSFKAPNPFSPRWSQSQGYFPSSSAQKRREPVTAPFWKTMASPGDLSSFLILLRLWGSWLFLALNESMQGTLALVLTRREQTTMAGLTTRRHL